MILRTNLCIFKNPNTCWILFWNLC